MLDNKIRDDDDDAPINDVGGYELAMTDGDDEC